MLGKEIHASFLFFALASLVCQQILQLTKLSAGKLLIFDEVSEHGLQRAAKDPTEEGFAGSSNTITLFDQGSIEIGPTLFTKSEGPFPDQAAQESLHRLWMPSGRVGGQGLDYFAGRAGALCPDHLHYFPFGFRDSRKMFHTGYLAYKCNRNTITRVI